jgi:hypothetical protein
MRRYIVIVVGLGLLLIVMSIANVAPALAEQSPFKPLMALVINDESNPVPVVGTVRNPEEPGRVPYEVWAEFNTSRCNFNCFNYATTGVVILFVMAPVPDGKRLIVQTISGHLPTTAPGVATVSLQTQRIVGPQFLKWSFGGPFFPVPIVTGVVTFNSDLFVTIGPGESPMFRVALGSPTGFDASITLSGYLIDAE